MRAVLVASLLLLVSCRGVPGSTNPEIPKPDGGGTVEPCESTAAYFRDHSWPQVFSRCVACHVAGGPSDGTRMVLKPEGAPDYLAQNMAIVTLAGRLMQDGQSLLVLKATNTIAHGGGVQLEEGSAELTVLEETLTRLANPVTCPDDPDPPRPVF